MQDTKQDYFIVIHEAKDIFLKKLKDYGTAWRVLRPISVADQIYIKAIRIRTIQQTQNQKIVDSVAQEFLGIINYAIIGLIQWELKEPKVEDLAATEAERLYNKYVDVCFDLMEKKNHDYGEAWRSMCSESFTDLIIVKTLRIKQIISLEHNTLVSEGIDANFIDILNYAVFNQILNP
ncbi:MAG: DUF1599 domain-containing protein [Alphaproteobacteria bacterium]|nr:DUF1599 domain-containing protein [Alphaproteobacteria bacterium]